MLGLTVLGGGDLVYVQVDLGNYVPNDEISESRAEKSCTRCVRTFCRESRTFEDILGLRSRTFVAILEQELRIDNSRLRIEDEV